MSIKKKKKTASRSGRIESWYQTRNLTCESAWGCEWKNIIFCLPFEKPCGLKSFWLLGIPETINENLTENKRVSDIYIITGRTQFDLQFKRLLWFIYYRDMTRAHVFMSNKLILRHSIGPLRLSKGHNVKGQHWKATFIWSWLALMGSNNRGNAINWWRKMSSR